MQISLLSLQDAVPDFFSVVSGSAKMYSFHSFRHGEVGSFYPALQALMGSFVEKQLSSLLQST